ncbi:AbrB/MazE/SpoVT family DNA-binding domain-containing protein [Mesorhizobium sp. YIM 152430]|jgi:antitoxin VapB|uniref:antitoxin n=1 Tax=Mesorhizobium sp. YIM 152430 TaxID=3031761 RepID=UPI0023DC8216|nr:AbrB/MazE/SpoVT family DNA-binding domain-containing protein [Mesorhizobium sp. YIM 152430]MDF1601813.1 AbrB/MazE/SpoVT family DNA-binding domain-containing protein [Mesorhizobium sp. YIM 152430]
MNAHDREIRKASLFRNGRSQAVRIPKEFEFEGDEVLITSAGNGKLLLEPVARKQTLLELLESMEPLPEADWMPEITDEDLLPLDDVKL